MWQRPFPLPGHLLVDCNRFVDYIVPESLAQRHPALRAQIANSHSHFRSHLNAAAARSSATARSRAALTLTPRTVRTLQVEDQTNAPPSDAPAEPPPSATDSDDTTDHDYRQHVIQVINGDSVEDDFESCFDPITIRSVELLGVDICDPVSAETVIIMPEPIPDQLVLRCLATTYDDATSSSYAHADNGSMANTVHDASLLYAYRPLHGAKIRLLDAGDHAHYPLGVGFLCVPTTNRGIAGAPTSVSHSHDSGYHYLPFCYFETAPCQKLFHFQLCQ